MFFHGMASKKNRVSAWDELDSSLSNISRRSSGWPPNALEWFIIVAIVGVLVGLLLPGSDWDTTHRYPPPRPIVGKGFAAVAREYSIGAPRGGGRSLSILPDGRYSFVWSGCTGVGDRESGTLSHVNDYVLLSPIKPIERAMSRVFLPIQWGQRSYLVEPEKLEEFCDAIIQGDEPRIDSYGHFYLARRDEPVAGAPQLPEPWAGYLRRNLVIGTIIEIQDPDRAKVDVGSADGLHGGHLLTVQGRGRMMNRHWKVLSLKETSCEVERVDEGGSNEQIVVGSKVVAARDENSIP